MTAAPKPVVCLFAGSSTPNDPAIATTAKELGRTLGQEGYDVVVGGAVGIMGIVATAARDAGAAVTIVAMEKYAHEEILDGATVLSVKSEAERFQVFCSQPNLAAHIALPGGPGTMREVMQGLEEAIYNNGVPVILAHAGDYMKGLRHFFDNAVAAGLVKPHFADRLKDWGTGDSITALITPTGDTSGAAHAHTLK